MKINNLLFSLFSATTSGTNMNIIINPNDVEIFSEQQQQQLEEEEEQHTNGHRIDHNKHEGLKRNELVNKNRNEDNRHDNDFNINDNGNDIDLMISTKSNAFVHLASQFARVSQPQTKQLTRTRHLPIPRKDNLINDNMECTPVPPPIPMHRKRQHRTENNITNQNFQRFQKSNLINIEMENTVPPPVPAHRNIKDNSSNDNFNHRPVRPRKLSLKLLNEQTPELSRQRTSKPSMENIDYRSMGKLLTKLKESQA